MKLYSAEMCRDGGSLCADFQMDDGTLLSILLGISNAVPKSHPYANLQVGDTIQNEYDPTTVVKKGTPRDDEVKLLLEEWLHSLPAAERERFARGELGSSRAVADRSLHYAISLYECLDQRDE